MLRALLTRTRHRMLCRDEYGHRCLLNVVPRPEGQGVRLRTALGDLYLSPLEVGQMRRHLAEAVLESETTPTPNATGGAA